MSQRTIGKMMPQELERLFDAIYEEMLSPLIDVEKYAPTDDASPDEEMLGPLTEGEKRLFAYYGDRLIWTLKPPADTPIFTLPEVRLRAEGAKILFGNQIIARFGKRLAGRQFELRQEWMVVATDKLRDGSCEDLCGSCILEGRTVGPAEDGDETICVAVLATGGWTEADHTACGN